MLGNRYIAFAVAGVLALVILYNVRFFASRQPAAPMLPAPVARQTPGPSRADMQPARKEPAAPAAGAWTRDPFFAGTGQAAQIDAAEGLHLTGIINRNGRSLALINGKVYTVNDRVGSAVITEIRRDRIVLRADGRNQDLSFDDYTVIKEKKR